MRKTIFVFGALVLALLVLFQLSKFSIAANNLKIEYVIATVALIFFGIGLVLQKKLNPQKNVTTVEGVDQKKIEELGISKREYEILSKVSEGLSNREIAEQLFVSESTVKTHVSNLFVKLDAKRRTQAIQKAKDLRII